MADTAVRVGIVLAAVVVALAVAWVARRMKNPPHPSVRVGSGAEFPGVVLFSSTTCTTCTEMIALLQSVGVHYREITDELEAHRFEEWGVVAVPLTVVIDADGEVEATFSGVPKRRRLTAAIERAGVVHGT